MTPLRQKMIDAMQVRGMSPRTHRSYLSAVTDLVRYYPVRPIKCREKSCRQSFCIW